jgi:hypothetical protein
MRRDAGVVECTIQTAVGRDHPIQHGLHLRRDRDVAGQ